MLDQLILTEWRCHVAFFSETWLHNRSAYSHFSFVRTISGKEKIIYYRELLFSEKFF